MKWLLTVSKDMSKARLREVLEPSGVTISDSVAMIPMDDGDVVVEVEGPADLPQRVKGTPGVKEVHPSSEMTLY